MAVQEPIPGRRARILCLAPDPPGGWERVRAVVDLGGGTGAMLAALLAAHPHLHGTLVDVPATVAWAAAVFEADGMAGRVETAARAFSTPCPLAPTSTCSARS
jgi:hypothetical protein